MTLAGLIPYIPMWHVDYKLRVIDSRKYKIKINNIFCNVIMLLALAVAHRAGVSVIGQYLHKYNCITITVTAGLLAKSF